MIIENLDLFKGWLTGCLQPLCDADPGALAKYVIALVKKDKPESELRALCLDQLEVFFQKETKPFVELLFETLNSKSYLKQTQPQQPQQQQQQQQVQQLQSSLLRTPASSTGPANSHHVVPTVQGGVDRANIEASVNGTTGVKEITNAQAKASASVSSTKSDNKRLKGSSEVDERDAKRSRQQRSKSRSRSPVNRGGGRGKGDSRDSDDRRSRRFVDDDRRRRSFTNRRYDNRYRDFRDRRSQEASERERDRDGRPSQRKERRDKLSAPENERSKSRSWSRSWSRSISRSPSRSRSRSWSRIRERNRDSTRNDSREPRSAISTASNSINNLSNSNAGGSTSNVNVGTASSVPVAGDHGDKDYRLSSGGVASTPQINAQPTATEGNHFRGKPARRCRDYDEKGYCMRGDLCPYDHGADPVVVEDVSVLGFPHSANVPPPHETYIPEPYNPEAPGMERGPPRMRSSFWHPGGPQGLPPSIRPPPSHQRGPPPHMFHAGPPPRTRELIGVPTVDDPPERIDSPTHKSVITQRTVLSPQHQPPPPPPPLPLQPQQQPPLPVLPEPESNGSVPVVESTVSVLGLAPLAPQGPGVFREGFKKGPGARPFDYNRLGPRKPFNPDRCILELRKVPRSLNNIAQLNSHFSKFGTVVNLQVNYTGDPEAALVQFSSHAEANAAYRCTEAVLNNRFIKVFWHNKENAANNSNIQQPQQQQQQAPVSVAVCQMQQPVTVQAPLVKEVVSQVTTVASELVSSVKPSIKERLGGTTKVNHFKKINVAVVNNSVATLEDHTEKAVLFSPTGNLSRTVFNPAALKKSNVALGNTKKQKEDHKKDTIKKKMELQKKKQLILLGHAKQQKVLFEKLDKCKTVKEKQEIKQVLIELSKTIEQLRSDIMKDSTELTDMTKSISPPVPKSKAEAEKELLDAEMDLYNKQHRGDDTTDLKKKVNDLKQQVSGEQQAEKKCQGLHGRPADPYSAPTARALGLLDSSGHLRSMRGNMHFRGRFVRGGTALRRGTTVFRGLARHTTVDRRPRKIFAEGATETERENLYVHFSHIVEVENIEILNNGIVFTFKNRKDAEKAMILASQLRSSELQQVKTSWFRGTTSLSEDSLLETEDNVLHSVEDVGDHLDDEDLLMGDDEEEEDSEARSWRR